MLLLREIKYLELYELRQIMEPAAAALAARRHTEDDMNRMRQALSEMKASLSRSRSLCAERHGPAQQHYPSF